MELSHFVIIADKFYVNETSGIVYTHGDLDSDLISLYNLTIVARDGGSRSTIVILYIAIHTHKQTHTHTHTLGCGNIESTAEHFNLFSPLLSCSP